jgi:hypothetical protein
MNHHVTAAGAGAATVWTPSPGRRFQVMGVVLTLSHGSSAAGAVFVQLLDEADVIAEAIICNAAMAVTTLPVMLAVFDFKDGYISTADGNRLRTNLTAALTAGGIDTTAWGIEV